MKYIFVLVITMLLCAGCVPVSAANVTYPQEYYTLGSDNDRFFNAMQTFVYCNSNIRVGCWNLEWTDNVDAFSNYVSSKELRRQTILMEKQNELLAEQNEMLKTLVPKTPAYNTTFPGYCNGNCSEVSP